jgi:glycosyltransferase involved in cell wall biosynthesis
LVCVGRICAQKGQLLLIEAARQLLERGEKFKLVLVGDGELRTEIEALVKRYKLDSCVQITGLISSEQLRAAIVAARALVLPSFAEGLPMVIMEAMALSRPIISTFVAGIPELVIPGEHGWLVPAGDLGALVEAMKACLEASGDLLARMGEKARKRAVLRHNVEAQAAQLEKLFFGDLPASSVAETATMLEELQ